MKRYYLSIFVITLALITGCSQEEIQVSGNVNEDQSTHTVSIEKRQTQLLNLATSFEMIDYILR